MTNPRDQSEALARQRYMTMNALRIGSIGAVILGIAIARNIVELPYALGVALALIGLVAFFFGPRLLARRWKSGAGDEPK